jgi:very-short-patch-repair endonuclease
VAVRNEYGVLIGDVDLGWPDLEIALEYDGAHHRMTRAAFDKDIRRMDALLEQGWLVIRITAADTEATVIRRLHLAWSQRTAA